MTRYVKPMRYNSFPVSSSSALTFAASSAAVPYYSLRREISSEKYLNIIISPERALTLAYQCAHRPIAGTSSIILLPMFFVVLHEMAALNQTSFWWSHTIIRVMTMSGGAPRAAFWRRHVAYQTIITSNILKMSSTLLGSGIKLTYCRGIIDMIEMSG